MGDKVNNKTPKLSFCSLASLSELNCSPQWHRELTSALFPNKELDYVALVPV